MDVCTVRFLLKVIESLFYKIILAKFTAFPCLCFFLNNMELLCLHNESLNSCLFFLIAILPSKFLIV